MDNSGPDLLISQIPLIETHRNRAPISISIAPAIGVNAYYEAYGLMNEIISTFNIDQLKISNKD